jgi:ketosteroid isomerase-like protein
MEASFGDYYLECAGRAQRRRHFCLRCAMGRDESGVALRLPPHSIGGAANVFWRFVVLVCLVFQSACTIPTTRPSGKPPENIAKPATQVPTNDVSIPKPEPVMVAPPPEINLEAERSALLETDLTFSRTSEEKGAAQAFYEFVVPDAINLSAGEPPIRGRDAIKVHLAAGPRGFLTWQPTAADVAKNGDMGFTWGTAIFQGKGPDDKPRINYNKYVSVWRKQNNGRWKVVLFSTSPSPPPSERRQ